MYPLKLQSGGLEWVWEEIWEPWEGNNDTGGGLLLYYLKYYYE